MKIGKKLMVKCWWNWCASQMSITSTFYVHILQTKVFCEALLELQFDFVIFWRKNIGVKCWWNLLQVSIPWTFYARLLHRYFCAKKLQSRNLTREKLWNLLSYKKFKLKMLMKLTRRQITFDRQSICS